MINRQEDINNTMPNLNRSTTPLYNVPVDYAIRYVPQVPSNNQTGRSNFNRNDDPSSYEAACG